MTKELHLPKPTQFIVHLFKQANKCKGKTKKPNCLMDKLTQALSYSQVKF